MKKNISKISSSGEGKLIGLLKFISFLFTKPGFSLLKKITKRTLHQYGILATHEISYTEWIKARPDSALLKKNTGDLLKKINLTPKISILVSVYDPYSEPLSAAISSVMDQPYSNWELFITGYHAGTKIIQDKRIQLISNGENNDVGSSFQKALSIASGEYVLFMEEGDLLTPDCLFELIKHINNHPSDKIIYTDEDTVDDDGNFTTPYFKPGWSPDSLLSRNYIGHTITIQKELLDQIKEYNGYYDLLLRATELTNDIGHISMVLYHCRPHSFSLADDMSSAKALHDAVVRRNMPATIYHVPDTPGCYRLVYEIKNIEKASIIIPAKDNTELLEKALSSILQKTSYPDYEIIVLNNNSRSKEFFRLMKEYQENYPAIFRCIDANFPFNFARLMNLGVAESNGKYVLMCNNDIEVIDSDWMEQMVSYAQHSQTGAVGVKLLYPDDTIQHAGIVLGFESAIGHVFANKDKTDSGYFNCLRTVTNYAAVTAACMMCRKDVYHEAGGMDERLVVEYNDIDLCLQLLSKGYYNIYLPSVEIYHYESATRGHPFRSKAAWSQHNRDLTIFREKWQQIINSDPFYNPNLSMEYTDFRLVSPYLM